MRRRLEIKVDGEKRFLKIEVETIPNTWTEYHKYSCLRSDFKPQIFDLTKQYIIAGVNGFGDFFIDQTEQKDQSLFISKIQKEGQLDINTTAMSNEEIWEELCKI